MNRSLTLIVFMVCSIMIGQSYYGAASFLNQGMGARAIGMGNAYISIVNDPSAIYWNPAGVVNKRGFVFQLSDLQNVLYSFGDVNYPQAAVTLSPRNRIMTYFNWGIGVGGSAFFVKNISEYDENADYRGDFNAGEYVSLFSFALSVYNITAGVTYKYFEQNFGGYTQSSSPGSNPKGADFGLQFEPTDYLSVGLIIRDSVRIGKYDLVPQSTSSSIAFRTKWMVYAIDYNNILNKDPYISSGIEFQNVFIDDLSIRLGINGVNIIKYNEENSYLHGNKNLSLGLGYFFKYPGSAKRGISIDIAYRQNVYPFILNPFSRIFVTSLTFF